MQERQDLAERIHTVVEAVMGDFIKNDYELFTRIEIPYRLICIRTSRILFDFISFLASNPPRRVPYLSGLREKASPGGASAETFGLIQYNHQFIREPNPIQIQTRGVSWGRKRRAFV